MTQPLTELFEFAQPYGKDTNRLLNVGELVKTMKPLHDRKKDVIVERRGIRAIRATNPKPAFGLELVGDPGFFVPTNTALRQIAEHTKIPTPFLRATAAKYPGIAADAVNAWFLDDDVVNRRGTRQERKKHVRAETQRQLVRTFGPTEKEHGILRAVLSSRYLIVDNLDVLAAALETAEKHKKNIEASGSLTDEKMYVRIKIKDLTTELKAKIPDIGKGHRFINEVVGASLLLRNSDVGIGRLEVVPEIEVLRCTNLLRSLTALAAIHIGQEHKDLEILSKDTIDKLNAGLFGRLRDIVDACFDKDKFQLIVDRFAESAGDPVKDPAETIENVTNRFGMSEDYRSSILNAYMEEAEHTGTTRFSLSQAITRQAHEVREDDFEESLRLEDIGSEVLAMAKKQFAELMEPAK